jgi:hypothetical protein
MMPIYTTRLYTAAAHVYDTTHISAGELLRVIIYILSSLTAQGYSTWDVQFYIDKMATKDALDAGQYI